MSKNRKRRAIDEMTRQMRAAGIIISDAHRAVLDAQLTEAQRAAFDNILASSSTKSMSALHTTQLGINVHDEILIPSSADRTSVRVGAAADLHRRLVRVKLPVFSHGTPPITGRRPARDSLAMRLARQAGGTARVLSPLTAEYCGSPDLVEQIWRDVAWFNDVSLAACDPHVAVGVGDGVSGCTDSRPASAVSSMLEYYDRRHRALPRTDSLILFPSEAVTELWCAVVAEGDLSAAAVLADRLEEEGDATAREWRAMLSPASRHRASGESVPAHLLPHEEPRASSLMGDRMLSYSSPSSSLADLDVHVMAAEDRLIPAGMLVSPSRRLSESHFQAQIRSVSRKRDGGSCDDLILWPTGREVSMWTSAWIGGTDDDRSYVRMLIHTPELAKQVKLAGAYGMSASRFEYRPTFFEELAQLTSTGDDRVDALSHAMFRVIHNSERSDVR